MALTAQRTAARISEGTRTARTLNQSLTPDPYLLQGGEALDEYVRQHRAHPPLRLIKPTPPAGTLRREAQRPPLPTIRVEGTLSRRQLDALKAWQRTPEPPRLTPEQAPQINDHKARRITWSLLVLWCVAWLGGAVWWALA